jgi:EAL domain-containing protein (putative c-di-GMP-specific phosphodiesterase class I)
MRSGLVIGFEALARWDHRMYGSISPDIFIPDLEANEIMDDFTSHIVELAIEDLHTWNNNGNSRLSINVSAANFGAMEIDEIVREHCSNRNTDIQRLTIEVTESAAVANTVQVITCLDRLQKLGVQVSIDDFGTGYSSLTKLNAIPCSELKIDKSFIENCASDYQSGVLVRSMIDLGHNLQKRIVAEGVENEQTLRQLDAWNCDIAQGFLISKSIRPMDVRQWMDQYAIQSQNGWN